MTALKKYQRLECPGLWRETEGAQRREVIVGFREATLVLSDPRTEAAFTHWSLPAVQRMNPGEMPARFAPAEDSAETLEIDDPDMVVALETVRGAVLRARPHPGRLRGLIVAGGTALVLGLGLVWGPGALVSHTAAMLPQATRLDLGLLALADLSRLTAVPCATEPGKEATAQLSERLFGPGGAQIVVLRDGLDGSAALPGGLILLGRAVVERAQGPEVAAGYALAAAATAEASDPVLALLSHAGTLATFRLLTTGQMDPGAVAGFGETFLRQTAAPAPDETLLARFEAAGVPSAPYAWARDPSGETTLTLIEADPFRSAAPRPLLADNDWVSLQAICGG
jgi:hypothetical protein